MRHQNSSKSFCRGVPVKPKRFGQASFFSAFVTSAFMPWNEHVFVQTKNSHVTVILHITGHQQHCTCLVRVHKYPHALVHDTSTKTYSVHVHTRAIHVQVYTKRYDMQYVHTHIHVFKFKFFAGYMVNIDSSKYMYIVFQTEFTDVCTCVRMYSL